MAVARRHFTAHGFSGTRLDAVALEAGCAKGAIYLEFRDKETLLREVLDETMRSIGERFEAEVVSLESPLGRIVGTLRFAYRQYAADPLFPRLLREDPDLRALRAGREDELRRGAAERSAMLLAWVDEGIDRGEIRADIDREVVPAMLGTLRFIPQHLGLVTSLGAISGERILAAILDNFESGLAARPGTAGRTPRRREDRA